MSKHVASGGQQLVRDLMRYLRWDAATSRIVIAPGGEQLLRRPGRNAAYWARWFQQEVREPLEADPSLFEVLPGQGPPNHPLYLMRGQLRLNVRNDVEVTGQGGALVLGLLAVPRRPRAGPYRGDARLGLGVPRPGAGVADSWGSSGAAS